MGIFINLSISKSVTREEWEAVYVETLQLIKHFPLAEKRSVTIHGIDTICLVKTEEHEDNDGWNYEKTSVGWNAVGDSYYMRTAEDYYLPRDLVGENTVEPDAGDALLGALPAYMSYDWHDERFRHVYEEWGAKTQGEPYHIYLLAVAALIEARLGRKAFTYGDITRGQFRRAVEIANQYLEEPIELPDRCYMERLFERVKGLPLSQREQLAVFIRFFLGTQDAEFGKFLHLMFPEDVTIGYWKERISAREIGTGGFDIVIGDYLLWGFDLRKLCDYVNFVSKDGEAKYELFVKHIMDTKLYIEDKNCADALKIDQEEESPYGVGTLFAQFVFAGARNKKVDRYIPIEDIKSALKEALDSKCNVEEMIDHYLAEEARQEEILHDAEASNEDFEKAFSRDPAEVFNQAMDIGKKRLKAEREKYDIDEYCDLLFYQEGNTIRPVIEKSLIKSMWILDSVLDEERYKSLLGGSAKERCEWIVLQNRTILICDHHWDKVFTKIENDVDSFGRYYSLFRVRMDSSNLVDMCTALLINDELYEYCRSLMTQENIEE